MNIFSFSTQYSELGITETKEQRSLLTAESAQDVFWIQDVIHAYNYMVLLLFLGWSRIWD